MGRQVIEGQNLSGRTINVTAYPDGHARQSYIADCDLRGAVVIGDIRGSDVLSCQAEGADFSQAKTYGCIWRGTTFDLATKFDPNAGILQDEVVYELVRRRISSLPSKWRQRARDILAAHSVADYQTFFQLANDVWVKDPATARALWEALPQRIRDWFKWMFQQTGCQPIRTTQTVTWPDGVSVTVDANNLPPLAHPYYRYELDQWIIAQAGPVVPSSGLPGRWCWTARIRPWLGVFVLPDPDAWFSPGYGGF